MRTFFFYHMPVLLYGALILTVSSIPYLRTPEVRFLAADKAVHFVEYALFALLIYRSMLHLKTGFRASHALLLSLLLLFVFAIFDEWVQKQTPGRHAELLDYVADVVGGTAVLTLLWWRRRRRETAST